MKKIVLPVVLLLTSCGTARYQAPKEQVVIHYVDSIAWHDSTIYKEVPVEKIVDIASLYDTLYLETSLAQAEAYVDTNFKALRGYISNKDITIPVKTQWKEKIVYKDSIQIKEVPVEVKVNKTVYPVTYWIFLGITVICIVWLGIKIYLKIKL